MSTRPKRPCTRSGCPTLTDGGYCSACQPDRRQAHADYARRRTDTSEQQFYGSVLWKRFRDAYAAAHPICEECERNGRAVLMKLVDHIVAIKDGGARLSAANAQSLCQSCQNRKHGSETR